jgi:hypothetical protein
MVVVWDSGQSFPWIHPLVVMLGVVVVVLLVLSLLLTYVDELC